MLVGMYSTRRLPGIQDKFLEFVNYTGGVLGHKNGQESRNIIFILVLITNVPNNHEIWKGDINSIKVPNQQAQE